MPPLECGAYVLDYLWAVGPALSDGSGQYPITHVELSKYQENTGIDLSEWEASTLVRLSKEYLSELHKASDRACPAPWACAEQEAAMRVAVGRDLEAQMTDLMDL